MLSDEGTHIIQVTADDILSLSESLSVEASILLHDLLSTVENLTIGNEQDISIIDYLFLTDSYSLSAHSIFSFTDLSTPELTILDTQPLNYILDILPFYSRSGFSTTITYSLLDITTNILIISPTTITAKTSSIEINIPDNSMLTSDPIEQRKLTIEIKRGSSRRTKTFYYNIKRS
jgi:hypothetical protein